MFRTVARYVNIINQLSYCYRITGYHSDKLCEAHMPEKPPTKNMQNQRARSIYDKTEHAKQPYLNEPTINLQC